MTLGEERWSPPEKASVRGRGPLPRLYRWAVALATVAACLLVLSMWLGKHTNIGRQAHRYVHGKPRRPFVYRVLVPATVRAAADELVTADLRKSLQRRVEADETLKRYVNFLRVPPGFLPEYAFVLVIEFCSLLGFAWVFRHLIRILYDDDGPAVDVMVLFAVVAAFGVYRRAGFIYDWPQLFLFTAALTALAQYRWGWYYPLVTVGLLNKETTCLIVLVFVAYAWDRLPRRRFGVHLAVQAGFCYLVRAFTVWSADIAKPATEKDNAIRDYFLDNVLHVWKWDLFRHVGAMALVILALAVMIRHYRNGPRFLQRAVVLVPAFVAAYLKGGVWREIRVMGEIYPVLVLLFLGGAFELAGSPLSVTPMQRERVPLREAYPVAAQGVLVVGFLVLASFMVAVAVAGLHQAVLK